MEFKGTKGSFSYSKQKGIPGHCFRAQVFGPNGESLASLYSTENEGESSANALLFSKAPEMLEMLQSIISLESIICMGGAVAEQWQGEAEALNTMMNDAKQLIKEATTINQ